MPSAELKEAQDRAGRQQVSGLTLGAESDQVAMPNDEYQEMSQHWSIVDALWGGTPAMRQAGREFLPQEPAEEDEDYKNRKERSTLFNYYKRTVRNLAGRVFKKSPVVTSPEALEPWLQDVDRLGTSFDMFARQLLQVGLRYGLGHVLVDVPVAPTNASRAQERDLGIRPYAALLTPKDVLGWQYEVVEGRVRLTQLRYEVKTTEPDGEFGAKCVCRIYVWGLTAGQVYLEQANGKYALEREFTNALGEIPLVTFYASRTGVMTAEPPLLDLAHTNVQHWQSSSDQRNILHVARVPILFGKGFQSRSKGDVEIGHRLIKGPVDADLKYVEHSGKAIDAGRQDLADLEQQMQTQGMELLMPRTGSLTATFTAVKTAENLSPLQEMGLNLQDALEHVLILFTRWAKVQGEISVMLNLEFAAGMRDAEDQRTLKDLRRGGDLTRPTLWRELQRRGVLDENFDAEREEEQLAEEQANLLEATAAAMRDLGGDEPGAEPPGDDPTAEG